MPEVTTVYPRIESVLATVMEEIEIAEVEAEAFRAFRSRLRRLEPVETASPSGGGSLVRTATVSGVDPEDVRAAYRDTVLSMDHYGRDYDEPLPVNVGAEFGAPVRELVNGDAPIPEMQRGIVDAAAAEAVEERRRFRRALEDERDSLESVARRLGDVERRFHEWCREPQTAEGRRDRTAPVEAVGFGSGREERLRELADDCQALSLERQRAIHGGPAPALAGIGEASLQEYLYGEADHRFPALVEIADVADRVGAELDR